MKNKTILKNFILLFIALLILAIYIYTKIYSSASTKNLETGQVQSVSTNTQSNISATTNQDNQKGLAAPVNTETKNVGGELAAPKINQ